MTGLTHDCGGMPRRDFLQLGLGGLLGLGFTDVLRMRAEAATAAGAALPCPACCSRS